MRRTLVFALVAAIAAACGSAVGPSAPHAIDSPSVAVAPTSPPPGPTPLPSVAPSVSGVTLLAEGPIPPGDYTVPIFGSTMTFTVDSPWIADTRADVWSVSDSVKGAMSIVPFVGKFLGTSCSATKSTTVPQSATSLMKALRASSDLTVGKVAKTTLAGHDAVQVDLTANAHPTCPTDPQIYLWVLPTSGEFHLDENESARVIASDIGNRTFVVVIESVPGMDQAGLITETGTILDTLTIH